jgi:hypothetical protein
VNVDEMDLASQALHVTAWRPEAYERARATLRGAMAESEYLQEAAPMPEVTPLRGRGSSRTGNRRRRTLGTRGKVGIGAGIGAIAAAAAVILLATSTPQPTAPTSLPTTPTGSASQPSGASTSSTGSAATQAPLVKLAAYLATQPKPAGDATLVERTTGTPGKTRITVWDLYADDGRYFFSRTEAGLPAQVSQNNSLGGGQFAREVAAAIYAVNGNLDTALLKMAWSPDTTRVPAWLSVQVKNMSVGGQLIDNYVWEQCEDALVAGSGNPQVRAGVLRLVSALPGITVTHGTADGQPTLTLAAGAAELGRTGVDKGVDKAHPKGVETGPAFVEAITINADTGIPLGIASGPAGSVTTGVTYVVTRVNLANIAASKF